MNTYDNIQQTNKTKRTHARTRRNSENLITIFDRTEWMEESN